MQGVSAGLGFMAVIVADIVAVVWWRWRRGWWPTPYRKSALLAREEAPNVPTGRLLPYVAYACADAHAIANDYGRNG